MAVVGRGGQEHPVSEAARDVTSRRSGLRVDESPISEMAKLSPKALVKLVTPPKHHAGRRADHHAVDALAKEQFLEHKPGFDGLAQA